MVRSIASDLSLRTWKGPLDLSLVSMSKILRFHFGESHATTLFTELRNAKQTQDESAQEFAIRLIALHQKILFVPNEGSYRYSEGLVQDRFLHAILLGLRNDNIR